MRVLIKNLRLRTIIGANDWERDKKQDIIIKISFEFDSSKAIETDDLTHTVDYKTITKTIINRVEKTKFFLIEKLADFIADIILEHQRVTITTIRIDKPNALRFADSVAVEYTKQQNEK